jgi:hypothetical protein
MMKFFIVSTAIVIAVTSSSGTVSAFAPSLLIQGTMKCSSSGGGLIFLNAATLDTAAEDTKTIATAAANVAVGTNGDTVTESTSTAAAAAAVEKAWPVMSDNFVKDSDRVLP